MIEAIQVAAEAAQANPATSPAAQPQAAAFEVHQFAEAYARGGTPAATGPNPVADVAQAQPSEGMRAIISAADNLNGGAEKIRALSQALTASGGDPTPGQLMQLTMATHQLLFKAELTSNVANRTSDGIQQLFRQQS